jgi:hypothetical protein
MVPRHDAKNSTQSDMGLAGSGSGAIHALQQYSCMLLIHNVLSSIAGRQLSVLQIAHISRKNWFAELIVTYN